MENAGTTVANLSIEQSIYVYTGASPPELRASSPGFATQWRPEIEQVLHTFGPRPAGVACPGAVFARPLGKHLVMVVHVADLPSAPGTQPPLGFHVLALSRDAYRKWCGEPFLLAERLRPDWQATGTLTTLSWPVESPPRRTVEQVRQVLRRIKGPPLREDVPVEEQLTEDELLAQSESPALLGGVQVLVDGGRLVFERPMPDTELLRSLWTLLPNQSRAELWPASFAFNNRLGFDVLVVPQGTSKEFAGYTTEEQAADYPEGRYELNLQLAAESGNQHDLNVLFERRSWNDTWRIAVSLMVVVVLLAIGTRLLGPLTGPLRPPEREVRRHQALVAASIVSLGSPLETATVLPAAREQWRRLEDKLRPEEE
jgi:hypothetical protein